MCFGSSYLRVVDSVCVIYPWPAKKGNPSSLPPKAELAFLALNQFRPLNSSAAGGESARVSIIAV